MTSLTDDKREKKAPDGEETTRVPHVVEGHRRLHQPLAAADGRRELVAQREDRKPLSRGPVF